MKSQKQPLAYRANKREGKEFQPTPWRFVFYRNGSSVRSPRAGAVGVLLPATDKRQLAAMAVEQAPAG